MIEVYRGDNVTKVDIDGVLQTGEITAHRMLDGKIQHLTFNVDGTLEDFLEKLERIRTLDNDLFKQFDAIRRRAKEECETSED